MFYIHVRSCCRIKKKDFHFTNILNMLRRKAKPFTELVRRIIKVSKVASVGQSSSVCWLTKRTND
jgi:hypothetical protein